MRPIDGKTLRLLIADHLRDVTPVGDAAESALDGVPTDVVERVFPRPLIPAAVLVPLVERREGLSLLLTQRTEHLKDHPGQISFPGGRIERRDDGPVAAALRESHEEIGLPLSHVDIIGTLAPHAVITGFAVTPVVGLVDPSFELRLDAFEVAEVFEVPLGFFVDRANRRKQTRNLHGLKLPTVEYHYQDRRIWGATAMMIDAFIKVIYKSNV